MRRHAAAAILLLAALGLAVLTLRAFQQLLTGHHFPASEDAAGHLYKSTMLIESLQGGHGVPILFPGWYAGSESFRYWPHLPYVLLAIPLALAPADPGLAVIALIAVGLVAAGSGVLLWRRQLGWPLTIFGAITAALLADPLRVAFAEGNLPRVVAHALFLPELALALAVARADRWHPWLRPALGLIAVALVSLLSHAMMAAAAGAAIMLVLIAGNLTRRWSWRRTMAVAGLIGIGTALAGWWLVPSLGGGITGTSGEAVRRGLFHFDLGESFDALATTDVHASEGRADLYVGVALALAAVAALAHSGRRGSGWPYLVAGLVLVLVVVDPFALLYIQLPLANLLWPIRLQSVGQVLVLLGLLHAAADLLRPAAPSTAATPGRTRRLARAVAVGLLCLVAIDAVGNLALVTGRATPAAQLSVRDRLAAMPGWREATLDLSRLGSPPTLLWRDREQLFGWGIQGARNIIEIVDLNETIERGLTASVLSRLDWWGVDDAVLDREDVQLETALAGHGFALRGVDGSLRHWGRAGAPRALTLGPAAVAGIGRNIRAWTPRFPQVVRLDSEYLDDARLEDLRRFPTLVLAWPRWRDRDRAETLVREYAAGGGRVIVELSGSRSEVADGTSRFLGVEAIRVPFPAGGITIEGPAGDTPLRPFDPNEGTWLATRYAGALVPAGTARLGEPDAAVVLGTSGESERIAFVGLNLAFHALLTSDPAADRILERFGGLDRSVSPIASTTPLGGYSAAGATYRFTIDAGRAQQVVIPVARHEHMAAKVNGAPGRIGALNDAVVLDLPAGRSEVQLEVAEGGNRVAGFAVSGLGLAAAAGVLAAGGRRGRARRPGIRVRGWTVTTKETQRTDELPVGSTDARTPGPFVVVLVEVTNRMKIPAPFDPGVVALVGRHGRPFPLATAETDALSAALAQLRPGAEAVPDVPQLATLVYVVPLVAETYELIPAGEVNPNP